jgi:5-methylcytosine-specific restriction enzyme A
VLKRDRQRSRALHTGSRAWQLIRLRILARDLYTCQACKGYGNHVDHIDGDSHNNADTNLQALCVQCHSRKTAKEDHGFGNEARPDPTFGADGYPTGDHEWT